MVRSISCRLVALTVRRKGTTAMSGCREQLHLRADARIISMLMRQAMSHHLAGVFYE